MRSKAFKIAMCSLCFISVLFFGCKKIKNFYYDLKEDLLPIISLRDFESVKKDKMEASSGNEGAYFTYQIESDYEMQINLNYDSYILDNLYSNVLAQGAISVHDFEEFKKSCELLQISDFLIKRDVNKETEYAVLGFTVYHFNNKQSAQNFKRWPFNNLEYIHNTDTSDEEIFIDKKCLVVPFSYYSGETSHHSLTSIHVDGAYVNDFMKVSLEGVRAILQEIYETCA